MLIWLVVVFCEPQVSELNRRGDLLMTFGNTWQQGDSCVECQDFETGKRVSIEIKPGGCVEMASIPGVGGAEESWDGLWLGIVEACRALY